MIPLSFENILTPFVVLQVRPDPPGIVNWDGKTIEKVSGQKMSGRYGPEKGGSLNLIVFAVIGRKFNKGLRGLSNFGRTPPECNYSDHLKAAYGIAFLHHPRFERADKYSAAPI